MRWRLIVAAVLLIPVAEIAAWIGVAQLVGFGWALLGTLATSVLGFFVVRGESRRAFRRFQQTMESGQVPGTEASNGALRLLGGIALVIPGYVTDLIGLLLLAPPIRSLARDRMLRGFVKRMSPETANRVFGPRRVRVRRGPSRPGTPPGTPPPAGADQPAPEVLEGEILEGDVIDVDATSTDDRRAPADPYQP
ncbi:MAG: FxsA family protein [Micromonosporaceae bacterium]